MINRDPASVIDRSGDKEIRMNKLRELIIKSPALWFFLLTFGISWGCWLPNRLFLRLESAGIRSLLHTLGLCGPAFSALIVTGVIKGKPGIITLLKRLTYWRVGWPWYVFVLFSTAVIGCLAIGIYVLTGGAAPIISFSLFTSLPGILTLGLTEEIGWRGLALPELLKKHGALTSAVIIGVIWAIWHLAINPLHPLFILGFSMEVVLLSVIFTWIYNNTEGSLLLAALYHTVTNIVIANLKIPTIQALWLIYFSLELLLVLIIIRHFGPRHLSVAKGKNGVFSAHRI